MNKKFIKEGICQVCGSKTKIKDGDEEYYIKKCEDCGIEMKVSTLGRKYCIDCKTVKAKIRERNRKR